MTTEFRIGNTPATTSIAGMEIEGYDANLVRGGAATRGVICRRNGCVCFVTTQPGQAGHVYAAKLNGSAMRFCYADIVGDEVRINDQEPLQGDRGPVVLSRKMFAPLLDI